MLAGIIYVIAFVPYVLSIVHGKTKPSRMTWAIWSLLNIITIFSYVSLGARNTLWMTGATTVGSVSVFLLSLRFGESTRRRLDFLLLGGAILSVLVWLGSGQPLAAQLSSLVLLILGAVPTIRIAYNTPERESRMTWSLFTLSCIVNFLSIERWTLGIIAGPIVSLAVDATVMTLLFRRVPRSS